MENHKNHRFLFTQGCSHSHIFPQDHNPIPAKICQATTWPIQLSWDRRRNPSQTVCLSGPIIAGEKIASATVVFGHLPLIQNASHKMSPPLDKNWQKSLPRMLNKCCLHLLHFVTMFFSGLRLVDPFVKLHTHTHSYIYIYTHSNLIVQIQLWVGCSFT